MVAEKEKAEECGHTRASETEVQLKRKTIGQGCQKRIGKNYHVAMVTSARELNTSFC